MRRGALPSFAVTKSEAILLAERGWKYQYRGTFRRHVPDLQASHLLAKTMPNRDICVVGDTPHPQTLQTLAAFRTLIGSVFGDLGGLDTAAVRVADCPTSASVFIRLYSRRLPDHAFNQDLQDLNVKFGIGMTDHPQSILSPAQAVTFFGKSGQVTHIAMLQPHRPKLAPWQEQFYRSILIEELFQTYSFGIDVFKAERGGPYASKLQESFTDLRRLRWTSRKYMEGLLASNPSGLCEFDAMMLHAVQAVPSSTDTSTGFIEFLADNFEQLITAARSTILSPDMEGLFDPACLTMD